MSDAVEKVRAAFAAHWRSTSRRADACINDVFDILVNPADDTPLSAREEAAVRLIISYLKREPPYE